MIFDANSRSIDGASLDECNPSSHSAFNVYAVTRMMGAPMTVGADRDDLADMIGPFVRKFRYVVTF
jgi:hypothetical protein